MHHLGGQWAPRSSSQRRARGPVPPLVHIDVPACNLPSAGSVGLSPLPARRLARAESSSSCSSLRVSSLLQSYQQHGGEGTRARPLCASCGTIGRPKRAFGSLLIAAHPQSTVPSPAARTRRDNTSRAQVPGVDDARLPGLLLHRRLRTRRPAAVRCGGRTCAVRNAYFPNHRRGHLAPDPARRLPSAQVLRPRPARAARAGAEGRGELLRGSGPIRVPGADAGLAGVGAHRGHCKIHRGSGRKGLRLHYFRWGLVRRGEIRAGVRRLRGRKRHLHRGGAGRGARRGGRRVHIGHEARRARLRAVEGRQGK